jgi:mRNA capping enzyme, C-terminal domain
VFVRLISIVQRLLYCIRRTSNVNPIDNHVHSSCRVLRQLPEKKALLYVNGLTTPFAAIRYNRPLNEYDNKIIECSFRDNEWHFHRQRTDKSFPNAKGLTNSNLSIVHF